MFYLYCIYFVNIFLILYILNNKYFFVLFLLFIPNYVLIGFSRLILQQLVNHFDNVCKRRKMKVNVGNSKVMVCGLNERRKRLDLCLSGEILKVVDSFKYLDYIVNKVGVYLM